MRAILLSALVALLAMAGLAQPRIGLLAYLWFALMRPDLLAWAGNNRYSLILAVAVLFASVREFPSFFRIFKNPFSLLFLLFQVPVLLSVLLSTNWDWCWPSYTLFLQISLIALLIPVLIRDTDSMIWLVLILGLSVGLLGVKFGLWGLLHGGIRISGGPGGLISENNTFAIGLVMALPLCWFSRGLLPYRWLNVLLALTCFFSAATVVMTFSRGGILALAVVLAYISFRSKHSIVTFFLLAALLVMPAFLLVGDQLTGRLATLRNPTEDGSARSRLELNKAALRMVPRYWLTGVGFGGVAFGKLSASYLPPDFQEDQVEHALVAHNNWLQMLVDSGVFAFLLYCALFFGSLFWLGRSGKRLASSSPGLERIAWALQGSLVGFAVGSTFASRTFYDLIYFVLMATAAWYCITASLPSHARWSRAAAGAGGPSGMPPGASTAQMSGASAPLDSALTKRLRMPRSFIPAIRSKTPRQ